MNREDIKVQDKVKVVSGRWAQRAEDGEVVHVGRVWVTIKNTSTRVEKRYRIDNQTDGSDYATRNVFWTLDQWAEREARRAALKFLRDQGIEVKFGHTWHGREIELANLIKGASGE